MTTVIIKYNKNLDEITKAHSLTLPKYALRAKQETNMEVVNKKIQQYKEAGLPIKDKVFETISYLAKRPFPYSVVNVNLVWVVHRTEAYGMILPVSLSTDEFIISLTHELMHLSWPLYTDEFKEKYKSESPVVRDHIIVHAMLEYLWRDVLNRPEYIDMSKSRSKRHSTDEYTKAWNIVEKEGYKKILNYIKDGVSQDT